MSSTPLARPGEPPKVAAPDEVKGEASDSRDVAVVRVVMAESETLIEEEVWMQGNDEYNMDGIDGIDEDLWQHIEAQLRDAKKPSSDTAGGLFCTELLQEDLRKWWADCWLRVLS